jgi:glycerol uptake facilitator-like aquaporin
MTDKFEEESDKKNTMKDKLTGRERALSLKVPKGEIVVEDEVQSTKASRFSAFLRSLYAELLGCWMFFMTIYGFNANSNLKNWDPQFSLFINAIGAGFQVITMIFCFSSLSGAQFNPAITFALWLVGKVSNRKCVFFILLQLLGSILAMASIYVMFPGVDHAMLKACAVIPPSNATGANIFFTELFLTFFLTFVCFALAFEEAEFIKPSAMAVSTADDGDSVIMYSSTPQSKAGFAPFAIGFTVLALVTIGGGSGVGMNPARVFGPMLFANEWNNWYLYYLGEMIGAGLAAIVVVHGPQSGKRHIPMKREANIISAQAARRLTGNSSSMVKNPVTEMTTAANGEENV